MGIYFFCFIYSSSICFSKVEIIVTDFFWRIASLYLLQSFVRVEFGWVEGLPGIDVVVDVYYYNKKNRFR